MSEFKNATNVEKITHLLAGELSNEEKLELENHISKNSDLKKEFKNSKLIVSLIEADRKSMPNEDGIGAERKNNIFGKHKENKKVISIKQFKFTLVAAALVLFSTIFLSLDWQNKTVVTPEKPSEVLGVSSFNMAMPSGTYFFTLKDGALKLDKIESLNGVDFFTESGVKAGDELLMLNGIDTKTFKKEEWRELLTSMIGKPSVLKIKRNGQVLPSK